MFSRLKQAIKGNDDGGLRHAVKGAVVDRLRGLRGGEGAAPPEPVAPRANGVAAAPRSNGLPTVASPTPVVTAQPVAKGAPVVKPEAPVVKPEAPVVKAEPPAVKAEPPVVKPAAKPEPQAVKAEPPVVKPAAKPEPQAVKAEPPVVKPAAKPEPVAKQEAPAEKKPAVSLAEAAAKAAAGTAKAIHADMGSTDVAHYIARAKANGRDVSAIKGGEGLNQADDGEPYWGPLDNESSRAKAAGKLLTIDQWECISCGTCVEQTDRVFYLPDDAKATPIAQDGPMDLIQDAIEACPVTCIHWVTPDEAAEKGLATGNEPDSPRPD